jgi:hypothetical protein
MERVPEPHRPRRPALLGKAALETFGDAADPAALAEAAHASANLLVESGRSRAETDPGLVDRLVRLADEQGIDLVAELWSDRPARTLPGALWRIYALREWVRRAPMQVGLDFGTGSAVAHVPRVVAGAAEPPTPDAMRQLADEILTGVFRGDLAVALERAGAFARVVAAGRAHRADDVEPLDPQEASSLTHSSAGLTRTAEDLEAAGRLWRGGELV